jgi:hypothetical protein
MENELMKYFITQGAFAALFVWLLITTKKDNKDREKNYQDTIKENQSIISKNQDAIKENQSIISKLTDKFNVVDVIQNDIKDIKNHIFK